MGLKLRKMKRRNDEEFLRTHAAAHGASRAPFRTMSEDIDDHMGLTGVGFGNERLVTESSGWSKQRAPGRILPHELEAKLND